jgi:nucleoside-diphosphate-sugar epimerase
MRILVTGAAGFIGRRLVKELKRQRPGDKIVGVSRQATRYPHELSPDCLVTPGLKDFYYWDAEYEEVYCDLTQDRSVDSLMLRFDPDMVFHFAGNPLIKDGGSEMMRQNLMATSHLLNKAKKGCRFVFASSAAVYGNTYAISDEKSLVNPSSTYGVAKAASEMLINAATERGEILGLNLRLAATVGPGATHGLIPDVHRKILRSEDPSVTDKRIELFGAFPGSIKPFTHVDDVVSGAIHFAFSDRTGPLNLVSGGCLSVWQVAHIGLVTLGVKDKELNFLGSGSTWSGDNTFVAVKSLEAVANGWKMKYPTCLDAVEQAFKELGGIS